MHAELITLASRLMALVQAFDAVVADQEALALASDKFQDLLKVCCKALSIYPPPAFHPSASCLEFVLAAWSALKCVHFNPLLLLYQLSFDRRYMQ